MDEKPQLLTCEQAIAFLETLDENAVIALDTEGTNISLDYRDGRGFATGISFAFRFGGLLAGYYPYRHPADNLSDVDQHGLASAITNFKGWFVFHNAKHDLVALQTLGIDYKGKFYDTMILCHLLNETFPYSKSLNSCVAHYLEGDKKKDDTVVKAFVAGLQGEWHRIPAFIIAPYAIHDAVLTLELFEAVEPQVFKEVPREYWEHKQKFVRTIIKMESRGVRIDVELCNKMADTGDRIMSEIVSTLGLNPGSPIDQRELFINRLKLPVLKESEKTGKPSFNKEVMEQYDTLLESRADETAQMVLTYRGWQKATSSNYKPYVSLLSPDGRLRPNYKLHGTKTGRMSCEKPNLQQIPRVSDKPWNGEMKAAFIPMDGYTLYEADFSQLELRLAAAYGDEQGLKQAFLEGRDVFTEMAERLNMPRFKVKTMTYTIQFGGGAKRLSRVFNVSLAQGQKLKEDWFNEYQGIAKVISMATTKAKTKGKLQLWSGRYRHFMFPSSESHKGFNAVIQGGAADIVNGVMVKCFEEIDNEDECRMLLQVHDSIVWEIKNGCENKYLPLIESTMTDIKPDFGVKFAVDIHKFGSE